MRISPCILFVACIAPACNTPETGGAPGGTRVTPASRARAEELIERGRALLDAKQPAQAQPLFEEAARLTGDELASRMWVLRAWMDQGRNNDTLDALDALDRAGEKGPEMTYLYGMAFARRAEMHLAGGVTDSSIQMNFLDANDYLERALRSDGVRFRDAYLPLARSAWFTERLDLARWAAERATEAYPSDPETWLARGRAALSRFVVEQEMQEWSPAAEERWSDAVASFRQVLELSGTPTSADGQALLAQAGAELGNALLWKDRKSEAVDAFATAVAWDPLAVDYVRLQQLLGNTADAEGGGFRGALEEASRRFSAHASETDARGGTLFWWLGWARFEQADWPGAEEAFQRSLALSPESANSWFYVALARQYRKDSEGALAALRTGWDADPAAIVTAARGAGGSLRAFENLIGWCVEAERSLDAALVAEMLAEADPEEPRHWNNMGLFLRDEGESLELAKYKDPTLPEPDPAHLRQLYERSFTAYQRALELSPGDPQVINDNALLLHYHLERDLERARGLYEQAIALAESKLAETDLDAEDRARFETAKDDATINLEALLDPEGARLKAEKRAKEAAEKKAQEAAENKAEEAAGESSGT